MPVEFDSYDESDERFEIDDESNAQAILSFLSSNPNQGFTPAEIHEAVDIPYGSVGPTLKRLRERDLVRHKQPYWAIGNPEHVARYAGMCSTLEAIESRLGPEDPDDWVSDAEPVNET